STTFRFNPYSNPSLSIVVITMVFSLAIYQKVFLFIDQILAVVFSHFKIGYQLYSISRTGIFAKPAKDASREINAEKLRISAFIYIFRCLKGNTGHRARRTT